MKLLLTLYGALCFYLYQLDVGDEMKCQNGTMIESRHLPQFIKVFENYTEKMFFPLKETVNNISLKAFARDSGIAITKTYNKTTSHLVCTNSATSLSWSMLILSINGVIILSSL